MSVIYSTPLKITVKHTGKMAGMQSLSTNKFTNPYCMKNCKVANSVCQKCYVDKFAKMYRNFTECFEHNTQVLTTRILSKYELPVINVKFFRFEAFGDIQNEIQLQNYVNICKANKSTNFALWTKNYELLLTYFKNHKKPVNLRLLVSSLMINQKMNIKPFNEAGIDVTTFTVYSKDFIKSNNIQINCGAKSCLSCHKCYDRKHKTNEINEILK